MTNRDYGLEWLDQDGLYEITKKHFGQVPRSNLAPPDPFASVAQASVLESSMGVVQDFEKLRKINKTISNRIGDWHQGVLGLGSNFESIPHSGVIDLRSVAPYLHPELGREVIVEVKNRYNTIKASSEKDLWDALENLARSQDKIAYVFQIVPKGRETFDRPWKVSGRKARTHVRHCDGRTAYAMVFERENALYELFEAFPHVLNDVRASNNKFAGHELTELFNLSFTFDETPNNYNF